MERMAARNGETDYETDGCAKRRNGLWNGWLRETEKRMWITDRAEKRKPDNGRTG